MTREERVARAIAVSLGYEAGCWSDFTLHARAALREIAKMRDEALDQNPVQHSTWDDMPHELSKIMSKPEQFKPEE